MKSQEMEFEMLTRRTSAKLQTMQIYWQVERTQMPMIESQGGVEIFGVRAANAVLISSRVCDSCQLGVYFGVFTFGCGNRDGALGETKIRPTSSPLSNDIVHLHLTELRTEWSSKLSIIHLSSWTLQFSQEVSLLTTPTMPHAEKVMFGHVKITRAVRVIRDSSETLFYG
jgi:hypothetical protein